MKLDEIRKLHEQPRASHQQGDPCPKGCRWKDGSASILEKVTQDDGTIIVGCLACAVSEPLKPLHLEPGQPCPNGCQNALTGEAVKLHSLSWSKGAIRMLWCSVCQGQFDPPPAPNGSR